VGVHARQGAAGQAHLLRFEPVTAANQPPQLTLDRGVGRIGLKGALHVPDGGLEVAFVLADDRHPDVGDKVVWDRRKHALHDVGRVTEALGLEIGLAQQAVGVQMARIGVQDVTGVGYRLVELLVLDKVVDFLDIGAQTALSHGWACAQSMPHLAGLRKQLLTYFARASIT
jgi:hypothetical protein